MTKKRGHDLAWMTRPKQKFSIKCLVCLCLISILIPMWSCKTQIKRKPIEKHGNIYGQIDGPFLHKWWHYYKRALSFADGQFWEQAELDLFEAISRRKEDKRRARTYGMHFIDYFPQRELGVIYYHQEKIEKAIKRLEFSLTTQESAKAKVYLNRARRQWIEQNKLDSQVPIIKIKSPEQNMLTKSLSIEISGEVSDDTFVNNISINNKPLSIDLSQKKMSFQSNVNLKNGINVITVSAADLTGKESFAHITIKVDLVGPVVSLTSPIIVGPSGQDAVLIDGLALDKSGLEKIMFENGETFSCQKRQEFEIKKTISILKGQKKIGVHVYDLAGNMTYAQIDLVSEKEISQRISPKTGDNTPPTLTFRNQEENRVTYLKQALIEGHTSDDSGVKQLYINGEQILALPSQNVYFSQIIALEKNQNIINVQSIDTSENKQSKNYIIHRQGLKIEQTASRWRIAVNELNRNVIGEDQQKSHGIEDLITLYMQKRGRFSAIDRRELQKVLEEIKLSQSGLVDKDTALEAGQLLAADCMLLGSVLERENSLEVYARLVDTETAEVLTSADVYGENVTIGGLRELGQGIEIKLSDQLPVVQGKVVKVDGNSIIINFGKDKQVKNGMETIIFTIGEPVIDPDSRMVLGLDVNELGLARIVSVMDKMSYTELDDKSASNVVLPMYHVITK